MLPEADAALEGRVDLDIEPRLDRAGDELHRHGINNHSREHCKRGEAQQQPQREPRAEHARAVASRHAQELEGDQPGEQRGKTGVQREQQRILPGEERRIAARRGEKKEAYRSHRAADDE